MCSGMNVVKEHCGRDGRCCGRAMAKDFIDVLYLKTTEPYTCLSLYKC